MEGSEILCAQHLDKPVGSYSPVLATNVISLESVRWWTAASSGNKTGVGGVVCVLGWSLNTGRIEASSSALGDPWFILEDKPEEKQNQHQFSCYFHSQIPGQVSREMRGWAPFLAKAQRGVLSCFLEQVLQLLLIICWFKWLLNSLGQTEHRPITLLILLDIWSLSW